MEEEKKKEKLISIKAVFHYMSSDVDKIAEGEAIITVNTQEIIISQQFKGPYIIKLTDILEINPADYKLILPLSPNGKLIISELGYEFENFFRIFRDARNELLAKYMLMEEKVVRKGIKSEYVVYEADGAVSDKGNCNITVYETGISILPENGKLIRIAYCEIADISESDYKMIITSEEGRKLELSKMGYEFGPFKKALSDTINILDMFAQSLVMELDPSLDTITVRNIARLLRDGKAAMKKDIEKYSSCVWKSLEKKIEKAGAGPEYNYLKSISNQDQIAIGLKQGLMGDLTSDYIWFLMPIYSNDPHKPGNAMAMEAVPVELEKKKEDKNIPLIDADDLSKMAKDMQKNMAANLKATKEILEDMGKSREVAEFENKYKTVEQNIVESQSKESPDDEKSGSQEESAGKATYLFKIFNRANYLNSENPANSELEIDRLIKKINKAMISINFRREPIYIEDDDLYDPKNVKYKFAVVKIPELRDLRARFIGRAFHLNMQSWKNRIEELLKYNITAPDEKTRFRKETKNAGI
ncbi:MAG: hypothetical protein M1475_06815 [Actinobacteria bacterium]|nr:hypothetical protein [Actinomycetota bacterium]